MEGWLLQANLQRSFKVARYAARFTCSLKASLFTITITAMLATSSTATTSRGRVRVKCCFTRLSGGSRVSVARNPPIREHFTDGRPDQHRLHA